MFNAIFDRDERRTQRMIAASIGLIILCVVSMSQSCSELKHRLWGVQTTAQIATVEPSLHERNGLYISFFMNDEEGKRVRVKRTVSEKIGPFVPEQEVAVEYLAGGVQDARLVAERSVIWPIVFLIMLGAVVLWVVVVVWQQMRN